MYNSNGNKDIKSILTNQRISPNNIEKCWQEFVVSRQEQFNDKLDDEIEKLISENIDSDIADVILNKLIEFENKTMFINYSRGFKDGIELLNYLKAK